MSYSKLVLVLVTLVSATTACPLLSADNQTDAGDIDKKNQPMRSLSVRVVDDAGQPIQNVLVTPFWVEFMWWREEEIGVPLQSDRTDANGDASVAYPYYIDLEKRTHTTNVGLKVDHPDYALPEAEAFIEVPLLESESPYKVKLKRGARVEVRPLIDGHLVNDEHISMYWSEMRTAEPDYHPAKTENGLLLPPMPNGSNTLVVARFDGDRMTHVSSILKFDINKRQDRTIDVPLLPIKKVRGSLDANVPRPVTNGYVQAQTIPKAFDERYPVIWTGWAPVASDGSFTIEEWPQDEAIQMIARCDGFNAVSGSQPAEYVEPPEQRGAGSHRPQCFAADQSHITIAMEPMVECIVETFDKAKKPVPGVRVVATPGAHWWNSDVGSYCHPIGFAQFREFLIKRRIEDLYKPQLTDPFQGTSNAAGQITIQVPSGNTMYYIADDNYRSTSRDRYPRTTINAGQTGNLKFTVEPKKK